MLPVFHYNWKNALAYTFLSFNTNDSNDSLHVTTHSQINLTYKQPKKIIFLRYRENRNRSTHRLLVRGTKQDEKVFEAVEKRDKWNWMWWSTQITASSYLLWTVEQVCGRGYRWAMMGKKIRTSVSYEIKLQYENPWSSAVIFHRRTIHFNRKCSKRARCWYLSNMISISSNFIN